MSLYIFFICGDLTQKSFQGCPKLNKVESKANWPLKTTAMGIITTVILKADVWMDAALSLWI